jgi:hypothetical protein
MIISGQMFTFADGCTARSINAMFAYFSGISQRDMPLARWLPFLDCERI